MIVFYSVHLVNPFQDKRVYYFGSIAAIYQTIPEDKIGVRLSRLYAVGVATGAVYTNSLCSIQQRTLIRKKTKRGSKCKS